MRTGIKKGTSILELFVTLAVIGGVLYFISPQLIKKYKIQSVGDFLGFKLDDKETLKHAPTQPWLLYETFPSFVEKHKKILSQWQARTTGPGTSGPHVVSQQERENVLIDLRNTYPALNLPPLLSQATGEASLDWGIAHDENGNAILAGGLVVVSTQFPIFILKNSNEIESINMIDMEGAQYKVLEHVFKTMHQWMWHQDKGQNILMVGAPVTLQQPAPQRWRTTFMIGAAIPLTQPGPQKWEEKDIAHLTTLLDGQKIETQLTFSKKNHPEGKVRAQPELSGKIIVGEKKTGELTGAWRKDRYEHYHYHFQIGNEPLSFLQFFNN